MEGGGVVLRSSEAQALAEDIFDGIDAAMRREIPTEEWVRDMGLWAILVLDRRKDASANPCEEE
jgi:hypothetical protein